jgi:hypothetical protein
MTCADIGKERAETKGRRGAVQPLERLDVASIQRRRLMSIYGCFFPVSNLTPLEGLIGPHRDPYSPPGDMPFVLLRKREAFNSFFRFGFLG